MSERHVLAGTAVGVVTIDVDEGEIVDVDDAATLPRLSVPGIGLPRVLSADAHGSRIVALLDRRPPLAISDDAGSTWREAGAGLPAGVAVAISPDHPDHVVYASRTRVYVSSDGGRFWHALPVELDEIESVGWDAAH